MIHTIESDNPFDRLFKEFWELGGIPYWDESYKILK